MSETYARRASVVGFLIMLVVCVLAVWFDWSQDRPIDLFIVLVPMFIAVVAIMKALLGSVSESERQRRLSDQLNRK